MIGWDTNVLLRIVLDDDPEQAERAAANLRAHEQEGIRIDRIVLVEAVWVMRRLYRLDRRAIAGLLDRILASPGFVIDRRDEVMRAVRRFASGTADFADYLVAGANAADGAATTYTFDRNAADEPDFSPL